MKKFMHILRICFLKFKVLFKNIFYDYRIVINIGKQLVIEKNAQIITGINSSLNIKNNVYIGRGCRIELVEGASLIIGNNVYFHSYVYVICKSSIVIGDNTIIAEFVGIRDVDHKYHDVKECIAMQGYNISPIIIQDDVWIGRSCAILKGTSIGRHSVIGANSVVTKEIPPFSVAVGSPAKVIKNYDFDKNCWIRIVNLYEKKEKL